MSLLARASNHLLLALLGAATVADIADAQCHGSDPVNAGLVAGSLGFAINQSPVNLPL